MKKIFTLLIGLCLLGACSENELTDKQPETKIPTNISIPSTSLTPGELLIINGNNFDPDEVYKIYFNKTEAVIQEITATSIKVKVPETATSGKVILIYKDTEIEVGEIVIDEVDNSKPSFILVWDRNEENVIYQIKEIDLNTGNLTNIGSSSEEIMKSYYNLNEIYHDSQNNKIVALHDQKSIWSYDLTTNTDKLIELDNTDNPSYRDLIVSNGKAFLLVWDRNEENVIYQIKEVDLNTGNLTNIGSSSEGIMKSYYDLDEIYYDSLNNKIVALHDRKSIWSYDLTTNTDKLIELDNTENISYRDLVVSNGKAFLLVWDRNEENVICQIKEIDLNTGNLTNVGSSSKGIMKSHYDLDEIHYDSQSNKIVALHDRKSIWSYDITTNTDKLINLDNTDDPYYGDLSVE